MSSTHRIVGWDPEDDTAWAGGNAAIARRNLIWSTATMHIAFSIWSLWSVVVLFMPKAIYHLSSSDKLLLAAVATLVGGLVRVPYTIGTAKFGGRNWAVASSLVLIIPTAWTLLLLVFPGQPMWMYLACAALTGLGGGNYSASLANVDAFYPQRLKGGALGWCGGVGNLGIAGIQLVGLLVLAAFGHSKPYLVCAIYLVGLAIVGAGAALTMDNLDHAIEAGHLRSILNFSDTWALSLLYSAAFGSFIGFAFAFPNVLHITFEEAGHSPERAALYASAGAFFGPLLGALTRVYGGLVADRLGGAKVTFYSLVGMFVATGALVAISIHGDHHPTEVGSADIAGYIVGFLVLFTLAGMANGSVLKMMPSAFAERAQHLDLDPAERRDWARSHSGALIGFATAIGALGGVAIDLVLRQSYDSSHSETPAFWIFLGFYVLAAALTWAMYLRHRPTGPAAPARAAAAEPAAAARV